MDRPVTGSVGTEQEERNRRLVIDFLETVMAGGELDRWPEYLSPGYRQHKPGVADGPEALMEFAGNHPEHVLEVVRSFVDGDYVILHLRVRMKSGDLAVVDIFRVEGGKVVEHWDVEQPIPRDGPVADRMFS